MSKISNLSVHSLTVQIRLKLDQIKNYDHFDTTDCLAINLMQLVYQMADIVCDLKNVHCELEPANLYYGDNFRDTGIVAFCGCQKPECRINPLVGRYKQKISEFDKLWPNLGYTMLL